MVLTKKFRATTFLNAFILNSIVVTITAVFTLMFHHSIDTHSNLNFGWTILLTAVFSFTLCMLVQILLFYLFAYGGGMLTNKSNRKKYHILRG